MKQPVDNRITSAIEILRKGGVGVLPTDTLYGIVASALEPKAVEKVYRLRRRNIKKPTIVLIGSVDDLGFFGIKPTPTERKIMRKLWPNKLSIVFKVSKRGNYFKKFNYLHRGLGTLAFRLPEDVEIRLKAKTNMSVVNGENSNGKKDKNLC